MEKNFLARSREDGEITEITEDEARERLDGAYKDLDILIDFLKSSPNQFLATTGFFDYAFKGE